jgi:predicted outer membrane repeat protein
MRLLGRMGILVLCSLAWGIITTPAAWAAGVVGTGSPASCDSNDLQTALNDGGDVTFKCGDAPHTIPAGPYTIEDDTTVWGDGKIILDGDELRQIFIVDNDATLTLQGITLIDGQSASGGCISVNVSGILITQNVTFRSCQDTSTLLGGGAVYNLGNFTAINTTFESNQADHEGGAIFNRGTFTTSFVLFEANSAGDDSGAIENDANGVVLIEDSAFVGNSAQGGGGAIGNSIQGEGGLMVNTLAVAEATGSLDIRRSLFVDNSSTTFGGAIKNVVGGMSIINSTFVRNTSEQGGAIFIDHSASDPTIATIKFSTFFDNRADTGGAIYRPLIGTVQLGTSILAGSRNMDDSSAQLECDGPALVSLGYNLIEDGSCVDGLTTTDIRNTVPAIGALQDNGGFSPSILPNAGSPALNKVPAAECAARDQRFAIRMGTCDIGATERGGLFESAYLAGVFKNKK